jgi:hypothetical protein
MFTSESVEALALLLGKLPRATLSAAVAHLFERALYPAPKLELSACTSLEDLASSLTGSLSVVVFVEFKQPLDQAFQDVYTFNDVNYRLGAVVFASSPGSVPEVCLRSSQAGSSWFAFSPGESGKRILPPAKFHQVKYLLFVKGTCAVCYLLTLSLIWLVIFFFVSSN